MAKALCVLCDVYMDPECFLYLSFSHSHSEMPLIKITHLSRIVNKPFVLLLLNFLLLFSLHIFNNGK